MPCWTAKILATVESSLGWLVLESCLARVCRSDWRISSARALAQSKASRSQASVLEGSFLFGDDDTEAQAHSEGFPSLKRRVWVHFSQDCALQGIRLMIHGFQIAGGRNKGFQYAPGRSCWWGSAHAYKSVMFLLMQCSFGGTVSACAYDTSMQLLSLRTSKWMNRFHRYA